MVDAAIEAKVGLFIFAGLPGVSNLSGGKYTKMLPCKFSHKGWYVPPSGRGMQKF